MRTQEEISDKINELSKKREYLYDFLSVQYNGSDVKIKVEKELIFLEREINSLRWAGSFDDLPF